MNAKQIYDQLKTQFEANKRLLAKQQMQDDLKITPLAGVNQDHGGMLRSLQYIVPFDLKQDEAYPLFQEALSELKAKGK